MADEAQFPVDWLDPHAGTTATDLDLAVLLVNTYDALADPPDRLHDLGWLREVLRQVGHAVIADALVADDLAVLVDLRSRLRAAFEATDVSAASRALNPLLVDAGAVPTLVADPASPSAARLAAGVGAEGLQALRVRLPVAVAERIAARGVSSLGECDADPCRCVYVDRTRGGNRRYCCGWCNDRVAARAYRRRRGRQTMTK
jgi:predicted RNA-binding Zn ribbon-like protein